MAVNYTNLPGILYGSFFDDGLNSRADKDPYGEPEDYIPAEKAENYKIAADLIDKIRNEGISKKEACRLRRTVGTDPFLKIAATYAELMANKKNV